jgi:hypothetical protein
MKKSEFKQLIKESVREVLVTEGFLSTIVAEVVKGIGTNMVTESAVKKEPTEEKVKFQEIKAQEKKKHLQETKKRMLDAIGKDAYGGVNVFEGTSPMRKGEWRQKHMFFEKPTDKRRRKKKERNRIIKKLQRDYDAKYKD